MDTPEGNLAPQRGWWSRNWKWVLPVGCLGMLATCGCLGAVLFGAVFGAIKNTGAYTEAVAIAISDSEVQAVLGPPIETSLPQGSVNSSNGRTSAELTIPLDGSKADGVLRVEAVDRGSGWDYSVLQVEVPGQQPIDLRDKAGGSIPRELPTPDGPPMEEDDAEPQDGDSDIKL